MLVFKIDNNVKYQKYLSVHLRKMSYAVPTFPLGRYKHRPASAAALPIADKRYAHSDIHQADQHPRN